MVLSSLRKGGLSLTFLAENRFEGGRKVSFSKFVSFSKQEHKPFVVCLGPSRVDKSKE